MLQAMRDGSKGIIAKVIVGLIIVTFALFGVESIVSLSGGEPAPAEVNGEEISAQDLSRAVYQERRRLLTQPEGSVKPSDLDENLIAGRMLERLIQQEILLQAAKGQKLHVSDAMLDQYIQSAPEFQVDGRYSPDQFQALLRSAGLPPLDYRRLQLDENLIAQERDALTLSAFVLENEVKQIVTLDRQKRDIRYFTIALGEKGTESVSDEAVQDYYDKNLDSFNAPETVVIDYVMLDKQRLAAGVKVSDEQIQAAYQSLLDGFNASEEREAAHILFEISEERDKEATMAAAQAVLDKLKAGEDFAALAKEHSDDIGTSGNGGNLGYNGRGIFNKPFEDALFALTESNTLSELVETEHGIHIVKLLSERKSEAPTLAESRAQLEQEIVDEEVEALFVDKKTNLEDAAASTDTLQPLVEEFGLAIQTTEPITRNGGSDAVSKHPKFVETAFSNYVLNEKLNSYAVELDDDRVVVLHLNTHNPARQLELAEVKADIVERLERELLVAAQAKKVEKALAELKAGDDLAKVAGAAAVKSFKAITRNHGTVAPAVRQLAFSLARPEEGKPTVGQATLVNDAVAIVALDAIIDDTADVSEVEYTAVQRILSSRLGQTQYLDRVNQLTEEAKIERL